MNKANHFSNQTSDTFDEISVPQGKMFGRYKIEKPLGQGGMGLVYKAYDTKLKNFIALKIVMQAKQTESIQRLLREASATAQLNHPNIVRFYETGDSPKPYFTMEYIDGASLAELIKEKKIKPLYLLEIMIKLCDALHLAHKNKILHRDIKPSNIMITKKGEPKIMDFGLAKLTKENIEQLSQPGQPLGTLLYMSPEQVEGKATEQSDIYSIGATIYEALTYRPIFQCDTPINLIYHILKTSPIPPRKLNPDLSPYLEAICLKCIHKKPSKRYQDFKQLSRELKNFKANKPIIAKKYTHWDSLSNFIYRNKVLCTTFFAILLVLIVSIFLITATLQEEQRQRDKARIARDIAQKARDIAQKERKIAQKKAQILQQLNLAMIKSLKYLQRVKFEIYNDKQFTTPLEAVFEQSIALEIATDYETLRALVLRGSSKQKNKEQSIKDLTKHLENNPKAIAMYVNRGEVYASEKQYQKAEADYNKALTINPKYARAYYKRGTLYYKQKKYFKAEQDLNKSLIFSPKHAPTYYARGNLYFTQYRFPDAERDLNAAISIDYGNPENHYKLGDIYYAQGKYKKAEQSFNKAIELNPKDPKTYLKRASVYVDQKKYKNAETDYNQAIVLNPKHTHSYNDRGLLYRHLRKYKEAERDFTQAIILSPKYEEAYTNRGILYIEQKKYKEAEKDFTRAITLSPLDFDVYYNRGALYYKQTKYKKAIRDLQKAQSLGKPENMVLPWINRAKKLAKFK